MTDITWTTKAWGREGQLYKLNQQRNDFTQPTWKRHKADQTYKGILAQLQDKRLMSLRERLIRAALANDDRAQALIQQEMRYYLHEDQETGLYEQA